MLGFIFNRQGKDTPTEQPERPNIRVWPGGRYSVDPKELLQSKQGRKVMEDLGKIGERIRRERNGESDAS